LSRARGGARAPIWAAASSRSRRRQVQRMGQGRGVAAFGRGPKVNKISGRCRRRPNGTMEAGWAVHARWRARLQSPTTREFWDPFLRSVPPRAACADLSGPSIFCMRGDEPWEADRRLSLERGRRQLDRGSFQGRSHVHWLDRAHKGLCSLGQTRGGGPSTSSSESSQLSAPFFQVAFRRQGHTHQGRTCGPAPR